MGYPLQLVASESPSPLLPATYDLVWSAVIFIVVLFFFWKYVLPRVQKTLDERAAAIEGNIAKADEAQREAEAALEKYTLQLAAARAEAAQIRETARADGARIVVEAKAQALAEAARVTSAAHAQIAADRQVAYLALRSEVGSLAVDLASGVVGESLQSDTRAKSVVDRFLAELEANPGAATPETIR